MGSITSLSEYKEKVNYQEPERPAPEETGTVVELFPGLGDEEEGFDAEQNALWEKFDLLQSNAQSWRDHESLDELVHLIGELRYRIIVPVSSTTAERHK